MNSQTILDALRDLAAAAEHRDQTQGDPLRLIEVRANLQAAATRARAALAQIGAGSIRFAPAAVLGSRVVAVVHETGGLPGDPPIAALILDDGTALALFQDPEGNPGGSLHHVGATGERLGIIS